MSTLGILGSLAGGYSKAAEEDRLRQFAEGEAQRRAVQGMVEILVKDPSVPAEYKGPLTQWGLDVAQTPAGKKIPSFDKNVLPAVTAPAIQPQPVAPNAGRVPPITLAPPTPPPGMEGATGQPTAGPTLPGRSITPPSPPPAQELIPAGQFGMLTPAQKQDLAQRQQINQMATIRSQFPDTSPENVFNASLGRPMTPPQFREIPPGGTLVNPETGQRIEGGPVKGEEPLTPDRISQLNSAFTTRYQILNPNTKLPPEYTLAKNATEKDFTRIDSLLQREEQARAQRDARNIADANRRDARQLAAGAKADNRSDKSYQFNVGQLNKLQTPIDQRAQRLSTMLDTINQGNPQADALVAPELLSVMAGGQGSGVRMNEAEIARIVKGRSNWESLKASMQKWSTDPKSARSITPAQDQMIKDLVNAVKVKIDAKQKVLDGAREQLTNTDDVKEHRQIMTRAQQDLARIDQGTNQITVVDPQGGTHYFPDQASADKFKQLAGIK